MSFLVRPYAPAFKAVTVGLGFSDGGMISSISMRPAWEKQANQAHGLAHAVVRTELSIALRACVVFKYRKW